MYLEKICRTAKRVGKIALASLLSFGILVGCERCRDTTLPPIPPALPEPELAENTYVVGESEINEIISLEENVITFSDSTSLLEEDIVVSGITDATPAGFLGRVSYTSEDKKTIYTESVTIEEEVKNAEFEFRHSLSSAGAEFYSQRKGIYHAKSENLFEFILYFDNVILCTAVN